MKLWRYLWAPTIISVVLGLAIIGLAWGVSDDIGDWLVRWYPWERGQAWAARIADVFGGLLVLAVGLIVFKQLILAIAGPFMSSLSERIERAVTDQPTDTSYHWQDMTRDIATSLRLAARNGLRELFLTLIIVVLGLIPIVTPFVVVGIFIIQAYYIGFGSMDFTLERHMRYRERIAFVHRHRLYAIANGGLFLLLLFTVVGFLVALPLSTAAATLGVHRHKKNPPAG